MEQTEVLAQDIPLVSFEEVKQSIEEMIESGHIQHVYSVRFGYVVYNETSHTSQSTRKHIKNQFDIESYYLVPTWVVECVYMDNPKKTFEDNGQASKVLTDKMRNSQDFRFVMINAQTGKAFDHNDRSFNGCGDSNYKGFIPWDDVN